MQSVHRVMPALDAYVILPGATLTCNWRNLNKAAIGGALLRDIASGGAAGAWPQLQRK